jgi:hypothetical protein
MSNPRAELGTSSIAISQAVIAFTAFLPNFVEVGKSSKDDIQGEVRLGEMAAVTIALSIGGLLGWMTGSYVPFFIAGTMSAILVGMYETALRKEV